MDQYRPSDYHGAIVTDHDAERRHEGPSYWVSTSLADLIRAERWYGEDFYSPGLLADLRAEITRRQRCIREATE
jgi:hypothetical protein